LVWAAAWAGVTAASGSDPGLSAEIAQFLNYGVLGLLVLAIFFGWVWARPSVDRVVQEKDASIARLEAERDRLLEDRARAEQQRDAALSIAQDKIVPLLTSFVSTSQTLIPLLQEIVREGSDDRPRRR
jgi:hypothetical protein